MVDHSHHNPMKWEGEVFADAPDPEQVDSPEVYTGPEEETVREIARSISRHSLTSNATSMAKGDERSPFSDAAKDTELDPNSPNFNARKWLKNMHLLHTSDPARFPQRDLGISFRNLGAYGYGQDTNFQKNVLNVWLAGALELIGLASKRNTQLSRVQILKKMDGVINPGEMLIVLGRPGAGCSTFLRTMAAQTHGFSLDPETEINYSGLSPKDVATRYRGDCVYCGESELHIPQLTVGDTLLFASRMKTPDHVFDGVKPEEYSLHMRDMIMATYGLSHTVNTKVGNDLIRGVSGGERKRVSIAELALCGSQFQCWDNSTRGLDSATALEFIRSLRNSADIFNVTSLVAVYQASEEMYQKFDKVIVLYEGAQIFFGPISEARDFFYEMGWQPKPRQPTPDFLTSLSQPDEREARPGFEDKVPRTAEEFYQRWIQSPQYARLNNDIDAFNQTYTKEHAEEYSKSYQAMKAKSLPKSAAYTVSFNAQIKALVARGFKALIGEPTMPLTAVIGNSIFGLILSSMFYNLQPTTDSFFSRNSLLFFALLFNGMNTLLEIFQLFQARPIVQKHHQYALYHPTTDALASLIVNMPQKIFLAIVFNVTIYFMANLRREPGNFFFFLLVMFFSAVMTSHLFRTIGAGARSFTEAMIPANVILFALVVFTGFVIPRRNMHLWCKWISWINPLSYAFESMLDNEYHDRYFECSTYAPAYPDAEGTTRICAVTGAQPGATQVLGDDYINIAYRYYNSHKWRNFGVLIAFTVFFLLTYLLLVWANPGSQTKGEVLVYPLSVLKRMQKRQKADPEAGPIKYETATKSTSSKTSSSKGGNETEKIIDASTDIFYWKDVCYDIKIKGEPRRLLNYVDGWVKPGTLTALMGASGAGKTTLLDTLANRVTMGVVSGHMFVNGYPRDNTFQRSTGYAMQQDLHLSTATVREALTFSALMRQPLSVPYEEKIAYVDNILDILDMEPYADAVVGVPGEGLNVEQRKRLTIGVELAAKPKLLLFLDEPTSGLDSQTAWSICQLLKKLSNAGQAILCTIHQPSALLLQQFDRLLFLAKGGRTVYFGDIGENSKTLTSYFERHGSEPCPPEANPAEWMLSVIGAAPGSKANHDYADIWLHSEERQAVREEIACLMEKYSASDKNVNPDSSDAGEFAVPFYYQFYRVLERTMKDLWRSPLYIWSKLGLSIVTHLFNGFTFFKADTSLQGLQNLMFSVFMFSVIINSIIQQALPSFVNARNQFEVRERPSKMYSWHVFMTSQMTSELPWQILTSVFAYLCWFYPIGFTSLMSETNSVVPRSGLTFFFCLVFYIYASSLGFLTISFMGDADSATNIAILLFAMCQLFCGVLVTKDNLPGFWIFMYRVSPMTYFIHGMLGNNVANGEIVCKDYELLTVDTPNGILCSEYLDPYLSKTTGYLVNPSATSGCKFCPQGSTNVFLESINGEYKDRWENFGIFLCYPVINYALAILFYYLARVPKKSSRVKKTELSNYRADPALDGTGDEPLTIEKSKKSEN